MLAEGDQRKWRRTIFAQRRRNHPNCWWNCVMNSEFESRILPNTKIIFISLSHACTFLKQPFLNDSLLHQSVQDKKSLDKFSYPDGSHTPLMEVLPHYLQKFCCLEVTKSSPYSTGDHYTRARMPEIRHNWGPS